MMRVFVIGLGLLAFAGEARAQESADVDLCSNAFEEGQVARAAGGLIRAKKTLSACTQETCPARLRSECAGLLREIESSIPSVIFSVDDGEGHDLANVIVREQGSVLHEHITGTPLEIDPGPHRFRFDYRGAEPVFVDYVARVNEKGRLVRVSISLPKPPPKRSVAGYAVPGGFLAVGLAGLATAGLLRLSYDKRVDDWTGRCGQTVDCSDRNVARDPTVDKFLVPSNVSLGIGIGSLALSAVTWWLLSPKNPNSPPPQQTAWAW